MARPSYVLVPRPISSSTTSERRVARRSTFAVSFISTMNVDSPRETLSLAPPRVSTRSTSPTRARRAGHHETICGESPPGRPLPNEPRVPRHVRPGHEPEARRLRLIFRVGGGVELHVVR